MDVILYSEAHGGGDLVDAINVARDPISWRNEVAAVKLLRSLLGKHLSAYRIAPENYSNAVDHSANLENSERVVHGEQEVLRHMDSAAKIALRHLIDSGDGSLDRKLSGVSYAPLLNFLLGVGANRLRDAEEACEL